MKWLIALIERFLNKPAVPQDLEKAKQEWEDAKRKLGK